jgi:osmoprotectant transport system substrate-binding protein
VAVASFNFAESELVAEIYARALEHAGVPVRRELNLGPRELVQPALLQGLVDVVPEYLGSALASLDPNASVDMADAAAVRRQLTSVLGGWGVDVLDPASAENQNGLVVTRATADRFGLVSVSDLARLGPQISLAGPPECVQRPYCLQGFERRYGLRFSRFVPYDTESQRVAALHDQVVDVAVLFTTDGALATGDLVLLRDDRNLQPAENIVPVVSSRVVARYGASVQRTLDTVSSALTPEALVFLNWRIGIGGKDVAAEAEAWLERRNLVARPG